ncbi:MAG: thymidylate synthase [Polyangiaceae bacterium]|nr:thymidylate synthase [Polyangiaceae bacterium]
MKQYLELVRQVLTEGERRSDRTGTGTRSVFGTQTKYDLRAGFPLLTTKKVLFPAVVRELLWFLRGATSVRAGLAEHTPIWDAWADPDGELGPIYGHQWRAWGGPFTPRRGSPPAPPRLERGIDQVADAIRLIKTDPTSRRILVSAWNVAELPHMALPPCHLLFQFYVASGRLDCQLYQRSADLALGVPFNIASYAVLMHLVAGECGLVPGIFTHTLGDAHVYLNHVAGLEEQLARTPYPLPRLVVAKKPVDEVAFEDIRLEGYQHHPFIKFPIAV